MLARGQQGQAEELCVPRGLHVSLWGWLALAASTQASGKIGTEGNKKLAENLKIPLYWDLPKYHCNANAVVRHCFMDL